MSRRGKALPDVAHLRRKQVQLNKFESYMTGGGRLHSSYMLRQYTPQQGSNGMMVLLAARGDFARPCNSQTAKEQSRAYRPNGAATLSTAPCAG